MMKNKNEMGETDIIVLDDDGIRVGEKPAVCRYGVGVFFISVGYRLLMALILQQMITTMQQKLISISAPPNMVSNTWLSRVLTK